MEIRATGLACGFAMLNAIIIMLVQVTPIAIAAISWRYFLIFIFLHFIFVIVVYLTFPETANVPLEEVAALFGDEVCDYYLKRNFLFGLAANIFDRLLSGCMIQISWTILRRERSR